MSINEHQWTSADDPRQGQLVPGMPVLSAPVVEAIAIANGVCVRRVPLGRIDTVTSEIVIIDVPRGATVTSKCPPCATRARLLRMVQCRQGWRLDAEPLNHHHLIPPHDGSVKRLSHRRTVGGYC